MTISSRIAVWVILCLVPIFGWGQTTCQIRVFQDRDEVLPAEPGPVLKFVLKAAEFQLEISPSACAPTIATIPSTEVARQIAGKPLIYSQRWAYVVAAGPEDGDKLLWWARAEFDPAFRKPPNPDTFQGKQYLKLCDELGFCPNVYPLFSSGHPFANAADGSKSLATFKRLDDARTLADVKGKEVLSVIYTLWKSLPSEFPMADPEPLLFRPNFVRFVFTAS